MRLLFFCNFLVPTTCHLKYSVKAASWFSTKVPNSLLHFQFGVKERKLMSWEKNINYKNTVNLKSWCESFGRRGHKLHLSQTLRGQNWEAQKESKDLLSVLWNKISQSSAEWIVGMQIILLPLWSFLKFLRGSNTSKLQKNSLPTQGPAPQLLNIM